jgi:hypothetical protein
VPVLILSAFERLLPARDTSDVAGVLAKPVKVPLLLAAVKDALDAPEQVNS